MAYFQCNARWPLLTHGVAVVAALGLSMASGCKETSSEPAGPVCGDSACDEGELLDGCADDCVTEVAHLDLDVASCSGDLDVAAIEEDLRFSLELARSLAALEEAAQHGQTFSSDFVDVLSTLAYEPDANALSLPMAFEAGQHTMSLASVGESSLTARIFFGKDYEAGKAGDLVTTYPFEAAAFFLQPQVQIIDFGAIVTFDGPGPLVELVGHGPDPESPLEISLFESADETSVQELELVASVSERRPGAVSVDYEVRARRKMSLGVGALTPLELESFGATSEQGASAAVDEWALGITERDSSSALSGDIDLTITGAHLPAHKTTILYHPNKLGGPEVFIRCE